MPLIVFTLWLTIVGRSTGHTILHVDLAIDRGTTSQRTIDRAVAETAAIWARYGVDVRAAGCGDRLEPAIRLNVVVAGHRRVDTHEGSIGSIEFATDTPRPYISLYLTDLRELVDAAFGAATVAWPVAQHNDVEGRVLGRALAHEVGHYLLRTRRHSSSGLMRANVPILAFLDHDRRKFALTDQEIARLNVLHAMRVNDFADFTARVTGDRNSSKSNPAITLRPGGGTRTYQ